MTVVYTVRRQCFDAVRGVFSSHDNAERYCDDHAHELHSFDDFVIEARVVDDALTTATGRGSDHPAQGEPAPPSDSPLLPPAA